MSRRQSLRERVEAKARELRGLSREILTSMRDAEDDRFTIEGKRASISCWIEEEGDDLVVFVRGHLPRFLGCSDEFDGFRIRMDDRVDDLTDAEIHERW